MSSVLQTSSNPMTLLVPCIYCSREIDPTRGEGDHVLPAGLGEFEGDIRFRRICQECNNLIGRSEQQLMRCSPPAFFRAIVQPALPRGRLRGRSFMGGAMGMPGPEQTIDHGDHREVVEPMQNRPLDVTSPDQLVVHDDKGNEFHIRLFPNMKPEHVQKKLRRLGVSRIARVWYYWDDENHQKYEPLLASLMTNPHVEERPSIDAGVRGAEVRTEVQFDTHYFRALAKIAFHYYLTRSPRGLTGSEPEFNDIRQFIMAGGDMTPFFSGQSPSFIAPFGQLPTGGMLCSTRWCHIFAVHDGPPDIVACLRLFAGPGVNPQPSYIRLGRMSSRILLPKSAWGHVYVYSDPQPKIGIAGAVENLEIIPIK